jgi:homoprotocatechuate degradation regulator HpaR
MTNARRKLLPYRQSLAGTLLAAREAVMAPLRPMLREAGVTEQQWRVLRVINDSEPVDATALADAALLFGPSVTRILKELADRGLITRDTDARDRRRSIVTLTAEGRRLIEHTASRTVRELDRYAERFGPKRLEALKAELRALIAAIGPPSV